MLILSFFDVLEQWFSNRGGMDLKENSDLGLGGCILPARSYLSF